MKRIVISSVVVLGIIGGGLFVMNNNINETQKPVDYIDWRVKPVINDIPSNVSIEILPTTTVIPTETSITTPIENTNETPIVKPTFEELIDQLFNYPSLKGFFYKLRSQYPERFTPDNIEKSFDYVLSMFDMTQPSIRTTYITKIELSFTW